MNNRKNVRLAGMLYAVGGALWLGWILGLTYFTGEIPGPTSPYFSLSQVGFIILQTLMFVGFLGIWWSRGVGRGLYGKIAFGLGWLGHFLFVLAEVVSLATGSEDLLAVAALSTTVGLLLTGIAVLRTKRWRGWGRWTPLLAGLYPLVGMFPFLIIYEEPSYTGIALWGLFRLLLGLAMREQANLPLENPSENEAEGSSATLTTTSF
jgi:hypothetical protein